MIVGHSVNNDTSAPLRSLPAIPLTPSAEHQEIRNPFIPGKTSFKPDAARQTEDVANAMPSPSLNFDGIAFPGVNCDCEQAEIEFGITVCTALPLRVVVAALPPHARICCASAVAND